jgi:hypothetical protein
MWWFDLERWLNHVETWRPNQRDRTRRYTETELVRLAGLLDTHEVHDGRTDASPPAPLAIAPAAPIAPFEPVAAYFRALEEQVSALTTRVAQLEVIVDQLELAFPEDQDRNGHRDVPTPPPVSEAIKSPGTPPEQAEALAEIARGYAEAGKRAVFPAVLKDLERRLGVSLKQSNYNGMGSARAWFDQALENGIIRYGPEDESGAPTILPVEEEAPERSRRKSKT